MITEVARTLYRGSHRIPRARKAAHVHPRVLHLSRLLLRNGGHQLTIPPHLPFHFASQPSMNVQDFVLNSTSPLMVDAHLIVPTPFRCHEV